jgi:hypothetical protein
MRTHRRGDGRDEAFLRGAGLVFALAVVAILLVLFEQGVF